MSRIFRLKVLVLSFKIYQNLEFDEKSHVRILIEVQGTQQIPTGVSPKIDLAVTTTTGLSPRPPVCHHDHQSVTTTTGLSPRPPTVSNI